MRTSKWLMAFAAAAATAQAASAAILPVQEITPGIPDETAASSTAADSAYVLSAVKIDNQTITNLTGTVTADTQGGDFIFWRTGGTIIPSSSENDAGRDAALTGLSYREGAANLDLSSTFQFGRAITASDYIFISDIAPSSNPLSDAVSFKLIDSAGAEIGAFTVAITSGNYGKVAPTTNNTNSYLRTDTTGVGGDSDTDPNPAGDFVQNMVAFQLTDFIDGASNAGGVTNATGIKLANPLTPPATDTGWDPTVVGLAAVPEPGTAALGLAAGVFLLSRRRGAAR